MVAALQSEDYASAAAIRDVMEARGASNGKGSADGHWEGIGAPDWLADRLQRLGFPMPLEVQRKSMKQLVRTGADALILSQTGSGKTLSYLAPILSSIDLTYFQDYYRNEIAELQEDLQLGGSSEKDQGSGGTGQAEAPRATPSGGPRRLALLPPPVQAVIAVPTFELGAQVCLTAFKLLGGNLSERRPGDPSNMYTYFGPKGVDITGMFSDKDVLRATTFAGLDATQILVGTPRELAACAQQTGGLDLSRVKFLVIDEFDACMETAREATEFLLGSAGEPRQTVLCGATLSDEMVANALQQGWVRSGAELRMSDPVQLPAGTCHRVVEVVDQDSKLLALARLLRNDLKELGPDAPPARVMVYVADEAAARKVSPALRRTLWGEHKMTTLLPTGKETLMALQDFRDNKTTLLLATPHHARGLDLPAVSHVYNLDVPESTAAYVHQAGRTGRVGWQGDGQVTTIITQEEAPALAALAAELGLQLVDTPIPSTDFALQILGDGTEDVEGSESEEPVVDNAVAADVLPEELIKNLEDLYNLFNIQDPNADDGQQ